MSQHRDACSLHSQGCATPIPAQVRNRTGYVRHEHDGLNSGDSLAALVSVIVLASLSVGLVIGAGLMRALGAR